jgi:hypothetical protein
MKMDYSCEERHPGITRIRVKNGEHEARVDLYAPDDWCKTYRVNYPIMGDESPEFAETMAAALTMAVEMARKDCAKSAANAVDNS